jgi:hypothetical protein
VKTPIDLILEVAGIGGLLGIAEPGVLRTLLPADCPVELKDALRANKPALLALLAGPPWEIVQSELLPTDPIFWTANDEGRDLLVTHGAPAGLIYTPAELEVLVSRSTDHVTLAAIHRTKRTFNGKIITEGQ